LFHQRKRIQISLSQLARRSGGKMKRLSLFASVIVLGMGTVSVFHGNRHPYFPSSNDNVNQTTDDAFRDGLYLGRLAAERGAEPHVAIARWATAEDRASFTAGYHGGYDRFLASRVTPANRVRQTQ
jgi:hypothetical protein